MSIPLPGTGKAPSHLLVLRNLRWWPVLLLVALLARPAPASVVYVDSRVPAGGDGTSWQQAKQKIGEALTAAVAGDEIWVATGTYVQSITLKQGVAVYGGFSGSETERDQRDPGTYPVQINADAGQLQAVYASAVTNIRLDGFTVKGGSQAALRWVDVGSTAVIDNCTFRGSTEEGIRCYRSSPVIEDCFIHNNGDDGIYCYYGSPRIERCVIAANYACAILSDYGSPTVLDTLLVGNRLNALYLNGTSAPTLTNCLLVGNGASAVYATGTSAPVITNCSFVSNTSSGTATGGAILTAGSGTFTLRNTVFVDNTTTAVRENSLGDNEVSNCLFRDNPGGDYFDRERYTTYSHANNINTNVAGASNNVDGDPLFTDAASGVWTADPVYDSSTCRTTFTNAWANYDPGALVGLLINCNTLQRRHGIITANTATTIEVAIYDAASFVQAGNGYAAKDLRLREDSACVDSGVATGAPALDSDGCPRPMDTPDRGVDGSGTEYDIGTYEYQPDYGPKTLTMMGIEGTGTVVPAQGGLYNFGDLVQLQATTKRGCTFDRWVIRQHVDPPIAPVERIISDTPYGLSMTQSWDVWAYFTGTPLYILDLSAQGPGTVTATPSAPTYEEDASVTIEATPTGNARFDRWEGSVTGSENPRTVTMNEDKTVTAVFIARYALTVSAYGGYITPSGGTFDDGEVVSLTAVPMYGLEFSHWAGDASGSANPLLVTMDRDKTVTAVFAGDTPDLRVTFTDTPPPSHLEAGQTLNIQWRVTNEGLVATGSVWVDRVYLSKDSMLDPGDKLLGEAASPGLLAALTGYAEPLSISVSMPDVAPGTYQFIVQTDATGAVFEMDESTAQMISAPFTVVDCAMSAP